jgi:hypothetical protein
MKIRLTGVRTFFWSDIRTSGGGILHLGCFWVFCRILWKEEYMTFEVSCYSGI